MVHGSVKDLAGFTVAGYTEVFIVVLQGLAFGIQPLISQATERAPVDLRFPDGHGLGIWRLSTVWAVGRRSSCCSCQVAMLYTGIRMPNCYGRRQQPDPHPLPYR